MQNSLESHSEGKINPHRLSSPLESWGKVRNSRQHTEFSAIQNQPLRKKACVVQKGGALRISVMYVFKENQAASSTFVLDACKCVMTGGT